MHRVTKGVKSLERNRPRLLGMKISHTPKHACSMSPPVLRAIAFVGELRLRFSAWFEVSRLLLRASALSLPLDSTNCLCEATGGCSFRWSVPGIYMKVMTELARVMRGRNFLVDKIIVNIVCHNTLTKALLCDAS